MDENFEIGNKNQDDQREQALSFLLVDIVKNNPRIEVISTEVADLVKTVYRFTDVLLKTDRVIDYYETEDMWQNERKRINKRQYYLTIRTQ